MSAKPWHIAWHGCRERIIWHPQRQIPRGAIGSCTAAQKYFHLSDQRRIILMYVYIYISLYIRIYIYMRTYMQTYKQLFREPFIHIMFVESLRLHTIGRSRVAHVSSAVLQPGFRRWNASSFSTRGLIRAVLAMECREIFKFLV